MASAKTSSFLSITSSVLSRFVSDFIIRIAAYGFRIKDIPRRAIYIEGIKQSQIVISRYIKRSLPMILKGWSWRILHQRKIRKKLKKNGMNKRYNGK